MENWEKVLEELFTGVMGMSDPTVWVMFAIGAVLIWLGVKKDYEPMLLFPMGVGCILANIPGHFAVIPTDGGEPGFLSVLYQAGIDALLELRHMGNDADKTAGALQIDQCIHRTVQCFRIQRAEAFIDEHGIEPNPTGITLHDIRKTQRERQ